MAGPAWYPKAKNYDQGTTGGTMIGGPPRGVIHSTETTNWAGQANYHIQFRESAPGLIEIRQYRPFNKASRALRNRPGGVQTNRQGSVNINICVVGYADQAPDKGAWSPAMYRALNEFAWWAWLNWQIPMDVNVPRTGKTICYGYDSICRMSFAAWKTYTGWAAHQNVPEQTHWDVGDFDWARFLSGAPLPQGDDEDMFVKSGDNGPKVEYWQRRIMRINPAALPTFGADGDYGPEMQAAVSALVSSSDGLQVSALEAEALDAAIATQAQPVDLSAYLTKSWASQRYITVAKANNSFVKKGTTVELEL